MGSQFTEPDERDRGGRGDGKALGVAATIVELLPSRAYRLKLDNEQEVTAHPAGAAVTNFVRLRPGDRVEVEISPFDRTRGRIVKLLGK